MRVFLNLFGGVAGDMLVAGLLDAGAEAKLIDPLLACLPEGEVSVRIERDKRHGIAGSRFIVETSESDTHRHLKDVLQILGKMPLTERASVWATCAFEALAAAEARAHDCSVEEVHFHEVGAIDAIVDIAAACTLMDSLKPSAIYASSVAVGSGVVQCAHGNMPVPAPATLFLLEGMPTSGFDLSGERATPTGVALLKAWQVQFQNRNAAICQRSGFGLGTRDPKDRANLLRVELEQAATANEWLVELRCLVDDQSGEIIGDAMDQLRADGALEVYASAASTKKGRPAFEVVLLCEVPQQQFFQERLFRLLGTLGLRIIPLQRSTLPRAVEQREDENGSLQWKTRELPSGQIAAKPEFEALRQRAMEMGLTPRELLERL
jgi:uncharacterized protein (TIGR00299 family) protein